VKRNQSREQHDSCKAGYVAGNKNTRLGSRMSLDGTKPKIIQSLFWGVDKEAVDANMRQ
jgi:hypothetical protein